MILSCNSCGKKFVVPDKAITSLGRMVQCGSCGNKWKQFPIANKEKKLVPDKKIINKKSPNINKVSNPKKKRKRQSREINLYSPEYLQKKHGINLSNIEPNKNSSKITKNSFGFYNSLLVLIVLIIFISRGLYFLQDFIVSYLPVTEYYLNYFFESIRNLFEIWKNLISNY